MARVRGCAIMLILLGLIGGIAPLCGYQNRLISSSSEDWGIPYFVIALLAIVAGVVILFITSRETTIYKPRMQSTIKEETKRFREPKGSKCQICGYEMWEAPVKCEKCKTPIDARTHIFKIGDKESVERPAEFHKCPFCDSILDANISHCPICLTNLTQNQEEYDFNLAIRRDQLQLILKKWTSTIEYTSVKNTLDSLIKDLLKTFEQNIDFQYPIGVEPITTDARTVNKYTSVFSDLVISGYCVGLEFGKDQNINFPILNIRQIPNDEKELFIVGFRGVNQLFRSIIDDVYAKNKNPDSEFVDNLHRYINALAYSILIGSFKLGVTIRRQPVNQVKPNLNNSNLAEPSNLAYQPIPIEKKVNSIPKENNQAPTLDIFCPNCGKAVSRTVKFCPYCFRDIPQERSGFDFDIQKREVELLSIIKKWQEKPNFRSSAKHLSNLSLPLREALFKIIDEGHQPGKETIKRNFDLSEVCGQVTAAFMTSGFCIGLEYGENGKQSLPITTSSIPREVNEMFIVAFQSIYPLVQSLIFEVARVRKVDEREVLKMMKDFNGVAMGVLLTCYRLGIDTTSESI